MVNKPSTVDADVLAIVAEHPGIALGDLCRAVIQTWHPASVRGRVALLAERGLLKTVKTNGRINVYPPEE